jgi:hypothetical protein
MTSRQFSAVLVAFFMCLGTAASAQSLAVKKKRAELEASMQKVVDAMNEKCGTKATFAFDWASFNTDAAMEIPQYCNQLAENIAYHFCGDGKKMEQEAIQKSMKKLVCKWDPKAPEKYKSTVKLSKDGTITFAFFTDAYNTSDLVRESLEAQLE